MENYFVINNSDGDTFVEDVSKEELIARLNDGDYYGGKDGVQFLDVILEEDTNYWRNKILIIKGEIVVPKAEKVVERYKL